MAVEHDFIEHVMEVLESLDEVTSKSMFGGYGIFQGGVMFALVSSDMGLCLKVDDANRSDYEEAGCSQFKTMPYYEVPAEVAEDPKLLIEWARKSVTIAHVAARKKTRQYKR